MSRALLALSLAAAVAPCAPVQAQRATSPAAPTARSFHGHWQVAGVAVSDVGVQALAKDDPSYMGRRLTFTPDRLSWDRPRPISTEVPCTTPRIMPAANASDAESRAIIRRLGAGATRSYSVACGTGSWGPVAPPAGAMLAFRDGTVGLWWYDGGLLTLRRIGR